MIDDHIDKKNQSNSSKEDQRSCSEIQLFKSSK